MEKSEGDPSSTNQVQKMTQEITASYPYYQWYTKS